jgi:hypothetical protein
MANYCKECRFYEGNHCEIQNTSKNANNSACGTFVDSTGDDDDRHCKTCRFFEAPNKCTEQETSKNPNNSKCGKYSPFK